jgi:hypothetical protein
MSDVFNRAPQIGGSMSAENIRLNFSQDSGTALTAIVQDKVGLIIQKLNLAYSQEVTRLYALESGKIYFIVGQSNGEMQVQHVVGPAGMAKEFFKKYGNPCNITGQFNLTVASGCGGKNTQSRVTVSNPLIKQVSLQIEAGNAIIASGFSAMFTGLDLL